MGIGRKVTLDLGDVPSANPVPAGCCRSCRKRQGAARSGEKFTLDGIFFLESFRRAFVVGPYLFWAKLQASIACDLAVTVAHCFH